MSDKDVIEYLSILSKLGTGNYLIRSLEDFISAISELNKKYITKEHFYRGHYYYKYILIPSLFRTTSNPLVALYMACDKPLGFTDKKLDIGEVIMMSEDKNNVKYSDSNITTILSSLSVLETKYKEELYDKITESIKKNDKEIYLKSNSYSRFVAEVSSELPRFDDKFFQPDVLLTPKHVKVGMINERIIAQSGSFILFGLIDYKNGSTETIKTAIKEKIYITNKEYILTQLDMLNINAKSMYPDMDHAAIEIAKKYK